MVTMATKVASAGLSRCCPVDGWLHYCTTACCVTSSSTPPIQGCSCAFPHVEIEMIQKMTKQVHLSCKNPSFWQEKSFKEVKTEAIAECCALSWASRHRSLAENRSAALFLIWPNQSGRTALKKVKEERVESHAVKTQQQSMAQIEVLAHRHPACYLKHISQAWKDSPCSPQDHWRWTSSRAADEMQVNQRKKQTKVAKSLHQTESKTFCMQKGRLIRLED